MAKKVVTPELKSLLKLCESIVRKDTSVVAEEATGKRSQ